MIFSILILPLSIFFIYISLTGLGYTFFRICSFDKKYSAYIFPIVSFPIIFFIVTILHFFTKLDPIYNITIVILSFFTAFFMRSFQELREGQTSENKYKDLDVLPDLTEVAKTNN